MLRYAGMLCIAALATVLTSTAQVEANAGQAYRQSMRLAAEARDAEAIAALNAAALLLPQQDQWKARMLAAANLLAMKRHRSSRMPENAANLPNLALATGFAKANPAPVKQPSWPDMLLAAALPGAGHAWQGRWRDAGVAALLVWPLLILTLWAARRRMGPVTVFFAMLTLWLWSGTVFSAASLAERSSMQAYMLWWQGLWQASGLPGRPW